MMISTDLIIPFIPRILQTKVSEPKLNITRIKKQEKSQNDLENKREQRDLSSWILHHHQTPTEQYQDNEPSDDGAEQVKRKHIDVMA